MSLLAKYVYVVSFNPEDKDTLKKHPKFFSSIKEKQPALIVYQTDQTLTFMLYEGNTFIPLVEPQLSTETQEARDFNKRKSGIISKNDLGKSFRVLDSHKTEQIIRLSDDTIRLHKEKIRATWKQENIANTEDGDTTDESDDEEYRNLDNEFEDLEDHDSIDSILAIDRLPAFLQKSLSEVSEQGEDDPALKLLVKRLNLLILREQNTKKTILEAKQEGQTVKEEISENNLNEILNEKAAIFANIHQFITQSKNTDKDVWMHSFLKHLLSHEYENIPSEVASILETKDANEKENKLIAFVKKITAITQKYQIPISILLGHCNPHSVGALFQEAYPLFQKHKKDRQERLPKFVATRQLLLEKAEKKTELDAVNPVEYKNFILSQFDDVKHFEKAMILEFFVKGLIFEKGKANEDILKYLQNRSSYGSQAIHQASQEYSTSTLVATMYQSLDNDEGALKAHAELNAALQNPNTIIALDDEAISLKECIDALKMRQLYMERMNQHYAKTANADAEVKSAIEAKAIDSPIKARTVKATESETEKAVEANEIKTETAINVQALSETQQLTADEFILAVLEQAEKNCENNEQAKNVFSDYYYSALLKYVYTDSITSAAKLLRDTTARTLIGDEAAQYDNTLLRTFGTEFPFNVIKNANKLPPNAWLNVITYVPLEELEALGKCINIPLLHIVNNKLDKLLELFANNQDEKSSAKAKFLFEKTLKVLAKNKAELSETTCEKLIAASLSHCGDMESILDLLASYPEGQSKSNLFDAIIHSPVYTAYLINNPEKHLYLWEQLEIIKVAPPSHASHFVPYTLENEKIKNCILAKFFSGLTANDFSEEKLTSDVQGRFKYFNAALVPPAILEKISATLKEQIILSFKHHSTFTRSLVFEDSTLFNSITTGFKLEEIQKFFIAFIENQYLVNHKESGAKVARHHQHNIITAFFRYFKERGEEKTFWDCLQTNVSQELQKDCINTYIFSNRTCMEALADVGEDSIWKVIAHDASKTPESINPWMKTKPDRYKVLTLDILTPLIETYYADPSEATERVLSDWLLLQFKNAIKTEINSETAITPKQANAIIKAFKDRKHMLVWSQLLGNPAFQKAWTIKYPFLANNLERLAGALYSASNQSQSIKERLTIPFYNAENKLILSAANETVALSALGGLEQLKTETQSHFGPIAWDKLKSSIKFIDHVLIRTAKIITSAENAKDEDVIAWKKLFGDYLGSLRRKPAENETPVNIKKELYEIRKTIAYALGGIQSEEISTKKMAGHALDVLLTPEHLLYFKQLYEDKSADNATQNEITEIIRMIFMANAQKLLKTLATPYRKPEWNWIVNDVLKIKDLLNEPSLDEVEAQQLEKQKNYWSGFAFATGIVSAAETTENVTKAIADTTQAWQHDIDSKTLNACRKIAHARDFEDKQQFKRTGSSDWLGSGGWTASVKRAEKYSGKGNRKVGFQWLHGLDGFLGFDAAPINHKIHATAQFAREKFGLDVKQTELKSPELIGDSWRTSTPLYYVPKKDTNPGYEFQKDANKNDSKQKAERLTAAKRQYVFEKLVERNNDNMLEEETKNRANKYIDERPAVGKNDKKSKVHEHINRVLKDHKNIENIKDLKTHLSLKSEEESASACLTNIEEILKFVNLDFEKTKYYYSGNTTLAWLYNQTIGRARGEKAVKQDHITEFKAMLIDLVIEESPDNQQINRMLSIVRGNQCADIAEENQGIVASLEKVITDSSASIEKSLQTLEKLSDVSLKTLTDQLTQAVSFAVRIRALSNDSSAVKIASEWCARLRSNSHPVAKKILTDIEFECANVPEHLSLNRVNAALEEKKKLLDITTDSVRAALNNNISDLEANEQTLNDKIKNRYPDPEVPVQPKQSPLRIFEGKLVKENSAGKSPFVIVVEKGNIEPENPKHLAAEEGSQPSITLSAQ